MSFEWGDLIETNGERPDWLRDGEQIACLNRADDWVGPRTALPGNDHIWQWLRAFKLPAGHPYYTATRAGFTYWPGGESAPDDWDGGDVLLRDGDTWCPSPIDLAHPNWQRGYEGDPDRYADIDIIGYRKRAVKS